MICVEAPNRAPYTGRCLFLAGGITGCPDWQAEMVSGLTDTDLIVVNPRRVNFPILDTNVAWEQIMWEHQHLRRADLISFWFPAETLCPITLYELGAWSMTRKQLFVGVHPGYQRRLDVEMQTLLARPYLQIVYSVPELLKKIKTTPEGSVV